MENHYSQGDEYLNHIRQVIDQNLGNEQFTVFDLAREVGLSRSMLHRKLIRLTGKSASELITETRLARAREILEKGGSTVSEVAYQVGFSSPSYFNKVFKKAYQETPGDVSRRGNEFLKASSDADPPGNSATSGASISRLSRSIWMVLFWGLVILSLVTLYFTGVLPFSSRTERSHVPDKSIVVLPFRNDSPDQENEYIINGYMQAILNNLSMLGDLRVINRESVEQYRLQPDIPEILRKFNVGYMLTGSGQKYGNDIRITVQLMDDRQEIIWSRDYDRKITKAEDHFSIQNEIAQQVAEEINAIITPQEMERMEKVPTASLAAFDNYQHGRELFWKYWIDNDQKWALDSATQYYSMALEDDSAFAEAYAGLARNYYARNFWDEYFSEDFMDSALSLVNMSLYYNHQLADAYLIRGTIYADKDLRKSARQDLQTAIHLNPNAWENYFQIGLLYSADDLLEGIRNLWKAASLNYGSERPRILRELAIRFAMAGFRDQSRLFLSQALEIDGDSVSYFALLAAGENWSGQYKQSLDDCMRAFEIDPFNTVVLDRIAYNLMFLGEYERAYLYYLEMEKNRTAAQELDINDRHRIGYVFWKVGLKEEANKLFDIQEQYCMDMIQLGRGHAVSGFAYYDLAGVYAFRGDKEKAMKNLRIFNRREINGIWMVTLINDDPLFDGIRNDPEFRQIVRDVELKYKAQRANIEQWLGENGL